MSPRVARHLSVLIAAIVALAGLAPPAQAATSGEIAEAQTILTTFAIPTGPVDGIWGPQTAQGLCTFRQMAGLTAHRGALTAGDLATLRSFNASYGALGSIPAPSRNGHSTYLLATRTCQTMMYVRGGTYVRVMRISTGKPGYATPVGNFWLGGTRPGWSCSTLYPESCYYRSQGINALSSTTGVAYSRYGNMYNKRVITGAYLLHGSTSVPTYPASHGCVRVSVANSDWLYRNVSNSGGSVYLSIIGTY